MTALLAEISSATQEQNKGVAEVSQAVTQMDQVTQSNASLVEEAAAAAESLNRQAEVLVQAVSLFRLDAGCARGSAEPLACLQAELVGCASLLAHQGRCAAELHTLRDDQSFTYS
jgi:hypothetical protein